MKTISYCARMPPSLLVVCLLSGHVLAQHSDIRLAGRHDGQLSVVGEASIFAGRFGTPFVDEQGFSRHSTSNPGFASLNASFLPDGYLPLPPVTSLHSSILSFSLGNDSPANLWYWDGLDRGVDGDYLADVVFAPLNTGSGVRMRYGRWTSGVADGGNHDTAGSFLGQTTEGGGLHVHPSYEVFGPGTKQPDQGVYLVSLGLQMGHLEDADPLYFVLRTNEISAAASDAARRWLDHILGQSKVPGDFSGNAVLGVEDIDLLNAAARSVEQDPELDLTNDALVDQLDRNYWVHQLAQTYFGDANLDGEFASSDLIDVFMAGEYEDVIDGNSGWATGDWDGDGDFTTSDLVLALSDGGYEQGQRQFAATVPEPHGFLLVLTGVTSFFVVVRCGDSR